MTGSPKVLVNGLWPLAVVTRVKVMPPSVEHDTPEKLLTAAPLGSLKARQISWGWSGLAGVYGSASIVCGGVSVVGTKCAYAARSNCGERAEASQRQEDAGQDGEQTD